jgi:hypothetical protein
MIVTQSDGKINMNFPFPQEGRPLPTADIIFTRVELDNFMRVLKGDEANDALAESRLLVIAVDGPQDDPEWTDYRIWRFALLNASRVMAGEVEIGAVKNTLWQNWQGQPLKFLQEAVQKVTAT